MRSGHLSAKSWGILAILFLLLEGCGHKGPLKLPAPQAQTPQAQTSSPQVPDSPKPASTSPQQVIQP